MFYGGIDNGNEGAMVLINEEGIAVKCELMPTINVGRGRSNKWALDKHSFLAILEEWITFSAHQGQGLFVALEKSQAMPKVMRGVSGAWKTGRDFGNAEMALLALGIPHEIVAPQTWQAAMLRGVEGSDTKARSVLQAQRRLPTLNLYPGKKRTPHDGIADAGHLARYALSISPRREVKPQPRRKLPPPPPPKR